MAIAKVLQRRPGNQPYALSAVLVLTALACANGQASPAIQEEDQLFVETIEPLLRSHCFECHSHDSNVMEGGLTLDSKSGWAEGGDRGPAIIPGKAAESLLIQAVRHEDADLQMPPDEALSEEKIQLLVEWINRGAPDPRINSRTRRDHGANTDWWSLRPLVSPAIPKLATQEVNSVAPIDAFVRHALAAQQLRPAPRADRRTLIRRLYYDLHGLPPTPAAVDAFVADPDPQAYENLVDRLLDSPRYGQRWARHWLDTIHFADSHGCEHDVFRPNAWRYRDYVIASFNRDTPWDRFIREQLAADVFYPREPRLTAALGFIAAGPLELSRAGTAPVTFDYLDRDDIVTQVMAAFVSSTANCARCHHHKSDPISQEDYYSLQAVFAGGGKGEITFDEDPLVADRRRRWTTLLTETQRENPIQLLAPEYAEHVAQWESSFSRERPAWQRLLPATYLSSGGAKLTRCDDTALLASGARPDKDTYTITTRTSLSKLTAIRLDVLTDESLPMQGPGRQDNGNLHLSEFEVFAFHADAREPQQLKIGKAVADWNQAEWTIAQAVDNNDNTAWGIFPSVGQAHRAVFELAEPVQLRPSSHLVIRLKQLHGAGHLIGRFQLRATDAADSTASILPMPVQAALRQSADRRSESQRVAIAAYALQLQAEQELAQLPTPSAVYGWSRDYSHGKRLDSPASPKEVHVLRRGAIDQPGRIALPGALSAIDGLPGRFDLVDADNEASRRAALADWLAATDNRLTWRSIVNRIWSYHFGRGLCDTPNDFGRMGGTPSHPELIDWLAVWFRDSAQGSLKQLHRMILLSDTWQQQTRVVSNEAMSQDTDNRFLWRMNARPLDAESYCDSVLQISGRIDWTMGGPGIEQFTRSKGQQLTPKLDYDAFDWSQPSAARRSIYRVVWRAITDPFMESLDFPDLGLLAPNRQYSVSALQALSLYNNDFVLHHSLALAERLQAGHTLLDEQVARACNLILLRPPKQHERKRLVAYAQQHGLAAMCRVLLNSNEFLFVD